MTQAYPLQWPTGWPRTRKPQRSRFDTTLAVARDCLLDELRRLGAGDVVISTDIRTRNDGLPYANAREPVDRGVAVYFTRHGRQQCIPCDRWDRVQDNLQAVRKTIEALRGLDRWGARQIVDAAFTGFVALPESLPDDWRSVLGVPPECKSLSEVRDRYRRRRREYHPDHGGDPEMFHAVQKAWEQAQQELSETGSA